MAPPTRYQRGYSFSGYQATSPSRPLPGPALDNELENIEQSIDGTITSLGLIQRSDGALRNGIVTNETLAPGLQTGVNPATEWETGISYAVGDAVFADVAYYRCIVGHISTVFADDLAAGYWLKTADFEPIVADAVAAKDAAETAAGTATTQAGVATTGASTATAQAGVATTGASTATAQAGVATTAAAAAATSESNANARWTDFDRRYLGAKASDPALDNQGNELIAGATYWNTTVGQERTWTGAIWQPTPTAADGSITDAKLRNSVALSVMGRSANSAGVPADIVAGTDGHILRRIGNVLSFGAILAGFVNFAQIGANALTRTVEAVLREQVGVSVAGYTGADATGAAASDAAINSALASGAASIVFPAGTWKIGATVTWPAGKTIVIQPGAVITVNAGVTLTIRSLVDIRSVSQVFTGSGTVLGIRWVMPEWFGAVRNVTTDQAPAFQRAQNCMEAGIGSDGGEMCLQMQDGAYSFGQSVVCTPNIASCIKWQGAGGAGGTYLQGLASWTGAHGVIRVVADAVNASASSAQFSGFRLVPQTASSGSSAGIVVGNSTTLTLQGGAHESILFEDVGVYDFAACWQFTHCRSITLRRCSGWVQTVTNGECLIINATTASRFTGDIDIYNFQATAEATGSKTLNIGASASAAQVAGVRLHSHIMYKGPANIAATAGGKVTDIWFTPGWQYDVLQAAGFSISADGAGSVVRTVKLVDGYIAGGLVGPALFLNAFTSNGGKVLDGVLTGTTFKYPFGNCVSISGNTGFTISNNRFVDANGGTLIVFSACSGVSVSANNIIKDDALTGPDWLCINLGNGSDYYAVIDNITGGNVNTGHFVEAGVAGANNVIRAVL